MTQNNGKVTRTLNSYSILWIGMVIATVYFFTMAMINGIEKDLNNFLVNGVISFACSIVSIEAYKNHHKYYGGTKDD